MDFVPKPDNTEHTLIPYLGGKYNESLLFHRYPQNVGWNIPLLRQNRVEPARANADESRNIDEMHRQAARFVQTWLFFGLLNDFFNSCEVSTSRLTCSTVTPDGQTKRVLNTKPLPNLMRRWCLARQREPIESRSSRLEECMRLIRDSSSFLSDTLLQESDHPQFIPHEQRLCLNALNSYLSRFVSGMSLAKIRPLTYTFNSDWLSLHRELLEKGCCRNLLERVRKKIGIIGVYYLALSERYLDNKSHTGCDEVACVVNMIDDATYETAHWQPTCSGDCEMMRAMLDNVSLSSLQQGQFPLLKLDDTLTTQVSEDELRLTVRDNSMKHVAVSHVWSDGLGNTHDNALPACQIKRLAKYLQSATASLGFDATPYLWVDTMCVPLQPKIKRKAAIAAMSTVYESASFVLVLDETLVKVPVPRSCEETLWYIFTCPWMTRLWTFQEAWLAGFLVFQFADRAVELGDLIRQSRSSSLLDLPFSVFVKHFDGSEIISLSLTNLLQGLWPNFSSTRLSPRQRVPNTYSTSPRFHEDSVALLPRLWAPITGRRTSHVLDVPLCIAAAMKKDVRRILDKDTLEERMEAFWVALGDTSSDVLFLAGPKLSRIPYRWALKDLLHPATQDSPLRSKGVSCVYITDSGLRVEGLLGFWLHWRRKIGPSEDLGFADLGTQLEYVACRSDRLDSSDPGWTQIPADNPGTRLALILRENLSKQGFVKGIILECESKDNGLPYVSTILAYVHVYQVGEIWDRRLTSQRGLIDTPTISARSMHAEAHSISQGQQFLIT
jgi:hypothetical protein